MRVLFLLAAAGARAQSWVDLTVYNDADCSAGEPFGLTGAVNGDACHELYAADPFGPIAGFISPFFESADSERRARQLGFTLTRIAYLRPRYTPSRDGGMRLGVDVCGGSDCADCTELGAYSFSWAQWVRMTIETTITCEELPGLTSSISGLTPRFSINGFPAFAAAHVPRPPPVPVPLLEFTQNVSPIGGIKQIVYGGGTFVAICDHTCDDVATSTDGVNWETHSDTGVITNGDGFDVVYGDRQFVLVCDTIMQTSPDGINWTTRAAHVYGFLDSVARGSGTFVAGGLNSVLSSPNGVEWTSHAATGYGWWWNIVYGNGKFVAFGNHNETWAALTMTSLDGADWAANNVTLPDQTPEQILCAFGNGVFLALDMDATEDCVHTSTDGVDWVSFSVAFCASGFDSLTYGNGLFVATGVNGIATSVDGSAWTSQGTGTAMAAVAGAAIGSGAVVAFGGGKILTSTIACANNEAFYVQVYEENIYLQHRVPSFVTAAGNLLSATLGASFNSYPSNNGYDYYDGANWKLTDAGNLFVDGNSVGPADLGHLSLGGRGVPAPLNDYNLNDLILTAALDGGAILTIGSARDGLRAYLRNLKKPYRVISGDGSDLSNVAVPFMLHLNCVAGTMFARDTVTTIDGALDRRRKDGGAAPGHTVVVYERVPTGYRVASGVSASRAANDRTCNDGVTIRIADPACVAGWTSVELVPPPAPAPPVGAPALSDDKSTPAYVWIIVAFALLIALAAAVWAKDRRSRQLEGAAMSDALL